MNKPAKKNKIKSQEKGVAAQHLHDYSNDPFFVKKAEAAKKVIEKYGVPKLFSQPKN